MATKDWKKDLQRLLRNTQFFCLTALSCPNSPSGPNRKIHNVAYRPTAYKTGVSAFNLNKCYHETNNWTKCNRRCPFPWDSKVLVGFFEAQTCLYSYTLVTKNREKIILIFLDDVSDSGLGSFASLGSNYLKLRPLQTMSDLADLGMQSLRPNFSLMSNLRKR